MYLLEKRSDYKTPIQIKLSSSKVVLGSLYVKALENYKNVSKVHATLTNDNGSWYIEDFGSEHGVFLNFGKIGKDPVKVENWTVIGLGGSFISNDAFTCVLCPYDKDVSKNAISNSIENHPKGKLSSKVNSKNSEKGDTFASSRSLLSTIVKTEVSEEGDTNSNAAGGCEIPPDFRPVLLIEKRSDGKTPMNIKLSSPNLTLGSSYIKALKNYTKISKSHAFLTYTDGSWYIKDLGSEHGVFLNFAKIGKDPIKVEYWNVIGLGGSFISEDVFTCVLCPYGKYLSAISENKVKSEISEESDVNSYATYGCNKILNSPSEFKPALLIEKRSDAKTPNIIKLSSPSVTLGSGYIKALKCYTKISKLHASLTYINGSWCIRDFGSANGVFVNFERIGKDPVKVEHWNVIGLGGSFISDDVFTCVLCPYDKALFENTIKQIINHSKEKPSSETNLDLDVAENIGANSSLTRACFVRLERLDSDSFLSQNSKYPMYLKKSEKYATLLQTNSNLFDVKNKVESYLKSIEINPGENNLYVGDETLEEHSQDDDAKSTSSSIESMNIIMYPSAYVLAKIQKSKKAVKRSVNLRDHSVKPSKSHFSESENLKKKLRKRPVAVINVQKNSSAKLAKKTKETYKSNLELKSFFRT